MEFKSQTQQEVVQMVISLSEDGKNVILLPDFSLRMERGVLKFFSRKKRENETETESLKKILENNFEGQFFGPDSLYSVISVKSEDGRVYQFFLLCGQPIMPAMALTIPISSIEKGKPVVMDEETPREYVPTFLLKEVVKFLTVFL